jgi:hypothetical protein
VALGPDGFRLPFRVLDVYSAGSEAGHACHPPGGVHALAATKGVPCAATAVPAARRTQDGFLRMIVRTIWAIPMAAAIPIAIQV